MRVPPHHPRSAHAERPSGPAEGYGLPSPLVSDTNEVLPWRVRRPRPVEAFVSRTARRAAAELGIDPAQIAGTGLNGRVTRDDVLAARTGPARGDEVVPFNNIRKRAAGLLARVEAHVGAHLVCRCRRLFGDRGGAARRAVGMAGARRVLAHVPAIRRARCGRRVAGVSARQRRRRRRVAGRTPRDQSRHRGGPRFPGSRRARRARRGRPPPPRARRAINDVATRATCEEAHARRPRGRDVHHHEPGRIGYVVVVPHHQPAAGRDRRHRRRVEAGDRRRARAGS